ncbi:uncharacterized protein MELLADRAFT_101065 [Melampsora larici-populina 98AG31]|uniref:Store-operated calcium entry-associated regulatory factor n=1 Tax=Melampsora larici-populina (strain 98AG31 / pathotype 3-4-7) TaxID=747676 RepID=F4R3I2_MELLP|nr:uncharacterized protein MELLADRAFT_101065 [Melampsora larici-populina 98AG31]EGG12632.1 hypothetical protein MELLADRAFT_101065 [Melampsora larici-populina 98AG31]
MATQKRVLLSSIDTLTFYDGERTNFRRTSPVLQLVCQGQPCKRFKPDVIQCQNTGGSGSNIHWKCEADLPSSIKLGRTEVSCEGFRNADDPYILEGSCGLTYTLKDAGFSSSHTRDGMSLEGFLFWALFAIVGIFIIYPLLRSLFSTALRPVSRYFPGSFGGSGGGGGGGGGGGWGWGNRPGSRFWGGGRPSDPPPPYSPRNPPPPKTSGGADGPWRPGFWTGLLAGTAATSGLFGGRGFEAPRAMYRGQGSSRDMDDSSNMGPIRSSTGFGGTRNR